MKCGTPQEPSEGEMERNIGTIGSLIALVLETGQSLKTEKRPLFPIYLELGIMHTHCTQNQKNQKRARKRSNPSTHYAKIGERGDSLRKTEESVRYRPLLKTTAEKTDEKSCSATHEHQQRHPETEIPPNT